MTDTTTTTRRFHLFPQLHDELQVTILSYIADAPFEEIDKNEDDTTIVTTDRSAPEALSSRSLMSASTLTHVLPYVNKKFYSVFSKSDQLWKDAILRQLVSKPEPDLWYCALQNIIHGTANRTYTDTRTTTPTSGDDDDDDDRHTTLRRLIDAAYQVVVATNQHQLSQHMSYLFLYRFVVNSQLRQVLPVFIMNGDVVLNESYGLHLFEYRYRYMIHILMQQHRSTVLAANSTATISTNTRTQLLQQYPVYFIHATRGNVRRSEMAVIAQVTECDLHPDGRADIMVQPTQYCWIERSWLYPTATNTYHSFSANTTASTFDNTTTLQGQPPPNNLYYAQVLKMGRTATNAMHYLQRQETLTNVMERLIASGIIVQDENGIHRAPPNDNTVRPVHVHIFRPGGDDDDDSDEDDGFM